ncbi:hippocampus abundant transcript 1 protein [Rosa sericea]
MEEDSLCKSSIGGEEMKGMEKRELRHLFVTVFLSSLSTFLVIPAITDVTIAAVCPGRESCSLAIYLSGFQQAIIGMGTVVMNPVIGNLSDLYGRKALLTFPLTVSIIPLAILAYSRETNFFYAFYVLRTLTAMTCEGSVNCLALAYVADNISERERVSAFGLLSGFFSASFVCGTLAARFLPTSLTFQVAALVSMLAAVYMRIFLEEIRPSDHGDSTLSQPILKGLEPVLERIADDDYSPKTKIEFKKIPSVGDLISLLRSSKTLSQAGIIIFFQSLAEGGMQATVLYFLKARFQFNKNQFADIMLIMGISGAVTQMIFMPMMAPKIGEEKMLSIGLLLNCISMFLNSIAWSPWVPYAATVFSSFALLAQPTIRSIASKQVGPNEQGKAQGCISGISSFANIIAPLVFSPLTALFLSEDAPFNFPGFSIMCLGLATIIALIQSTMIRASPPISSHNLA